MWWVTEIYPFQKLNCAFHAWITSMKKQSLLKSIQTISPSHPFHLQLARKRGAFSSIFSINAINWCGLGTALRTTSKIASGAEACFKRGEKVHYLFKTPIKSPQQKLSRPILFSRLSVNWMFMLWWIKINSEGIILNKLKADDIIIFQPTIESGKGKTWIQFHDEYCNGIF